MTMQATAEARQTMRRELTKKLNLDAAHIDLMQALLDAHRDYRASEAALAAHDAKRDAQRGALQQMADERYANLCDLLELAPKKGAQS